MLIALIIFDLIINQIYLNSSHAISEILDIHCSTNKLSLDSIITLNNASVPLFLINILPSSPIANSAFLNRLSDKQQPVLVFDGATGTSLQDLDLTADDFGGPK